MMTENTQGETPETMTHSQDNDENPGSQPVSPEIEPGRIPGVDPEYNPAPEPEIEPGRIPDDSLIPHK